MAETLLEMAKPALPQAQRERLPQAQAHAERAADRVNADLAPRMPEFRQRFSALQTGPDSKMRRLVKIRALADDMGAAAADHAACRKGCSHCCHIPVAMLQVEADLIGRAIGVTPRQLKKSVSPEERGFGYHMPCPFLKDNACSIYEHRPLSCRVHFNLDADPLLCELLPEVTVPVPLMNMTPVQTVYIATLRNEKLGDIRDFFPDGAP